MSRCHRHPNRIKNACIRAFFTRKGLRVSGMLLIIFCLSSLMIQAQSEMLPFGDMESWTVRYIKESSLLGGETRTIFVLARTDTIRENKAYDFSQTIWGISNAYANVLGVEKAAVTTQPEVRGDGFCARLDTRMVTVSVLGIVDLHVVITGTLFLGSVNEPVRSANDPWGSIVMGVPFSRRPRALVFDLKTLVSEEQHLTKATGLGRVKEIHGHDVPEAYIFLQKRWEENGHIYAKRVGTARHRFEKTLSEWQNDYCMEINYGDISRRPDFKKDQGLSPDCGVFKARNAEGDMVEIEEVGWACSDETPTHVILMISAGCYPAFYGHIGNTVWVDNVRFVY